MLPVFVQTTYNHFFYFFIFFISRLLEKNNSHIHIDVLKMPLLQGLRSFHNVSFLLFM